MKRVFLFFLSLVLAEASLWAYEPTTLQPLKSPDGRLEMTFKLWDGPGDDGHITYSLYRDGKPVVLDSRMGFTLEWRKSDLASGFRIRHIQFDSVDEVWHPVWGEESNIRNHYNEMKVDLCQDYYLDHEGKRVDKPTVMVIRFRIYDDGLGFRYEFPSEVAVDLNSGRAV